MTPWEADLRKIEALPVGERAGVMRWKMVTGIAVKTLPACAVAVTAFVKWMAS